MGRPNQFSKSDEGENIGAGATIQIPIGLNY